MDDKVCELGYSKGKRTIYNIHHDPLLKDTEELSLSDKSVILALGGAKGITSEIIIKLAKRYKCKFVLVGRSKFPELDEDEATSGISSVSVITSYSIHYTKLYEKISNREPGKTNN